MSVSRRYGFFKCPTCKRGWESAHAWCYYNTDKPSSGQQCQNTACSNDYIKPYKVERLRCPKCKSNTGCVCDSDDDDDDDEDDERHNNPEKPHRSDLCERCNKGQSCKFR